MHKPQTIPFVSSYFKYKIYPFERPKEMDGNQQAGHPVIVIGAGPIGLVLAIRLRQHGVPCVLIEAEAQVSGGSRAVALSRRSMEIIEQVGVAPRFLEHAITWREGRSYYRNAVVHHLQMPFDPDDKYEPMTNLQQCMMEEILVDQALDSGVELRFQTKLTDLKQDGEHVCLTLDTPEGSYETKASWVVACDGARSTVRKLMNLRYEGESFESRFLIADFKIDLDAPVGRRCYFEPPWLPGQTALVHKTPLGVWRLDYQLPEELSDEEALDPARIARDIQAHLDYIGIDAPWKIEWTSLYKPNAMTLGNYCHGRVLFCGDAAHLLPVFGVRGMNTGVQDSINLAWKLAAIVKKQASASLLESYSHERVADARQICVEASRSTRMVAPPTFGYRVLQQAVLSLAIDKEWVRGLLHWRTSHPIDYADSAITYLDPTDGMFEGGPPPGAPPRNVGLDAGQGFLLDHTGAGFTVLVFGGHPDFIHTVQQDVNDLVSRGVEVRMIQLGRGNVSGNNIRLSDESGRLAAAYGCPGPAVYLLRPDQHVLSRWTDSSESRVRDLILRMLDLLA
ncbi:MAG: FAD-dependent monooxygenase [Candidatus Hydrogenedentes bacterium]|nr:FAD-dependent monooxygenase [Candidatus Hydrogenedentota bacterium]